MNDILIAKVLKPFGVKGEVKVYCYTDFPNDRFKIGQDLLLALGDSNFNLTIVSARDIGHNCWALKFNDIFDMDGAEKLRNYDIFIRADKIPPLPKGQYYFRDLKDCDIYLATQKIGKVLFVEEGIQCNYLRIVNLEGKNKLIPFLPTFIENVDLEKKKIVIVDWPGLI